ncbi:MAG: tetratricopeptide repeat protein [Candidatus Omnitrophica bacterium]|nr:tetratricopeptide repeat protein [Candidatus Omnitrophota bacterium]
MRIKKKQIGMICCIAVICVITYANSLGNGFLIDDQNIIVKNDALSRPDAFSAAFLGQLMPNYYRPIAMSSFVIDYFFWKLNPFGYHLTNILLHTLNAVLFFILLFILFEDSFLSFLSSIFFAIHPLNSVTVNYISDRGNSLAGFFMLCALLLFYRGCTQRKTQPYLLGYGAFCIALLCRESAVLFPLYLLCMFAVLYNRLTWKKIGIMVGIGLLISGTYIFCRFKFLPLSSSLFAETSAMFTFENFSAFIHMVIRYFALTIMPFNVCFFRAITPLSFDIPTISTVLFIIVCVFAVITDKEQGKKRWFAVCWFLTGVFPLYKLMVSYRKDIGLVMQDNWIYFSSMGLFLMLGMFIVYLRKWIMKPILVFISSVMILFYAFITFSTNRFWRDTPTYCNFWLELMPKNIIASWSLAEFYYDQGSFDKAIIYYRKAIEDGKFERQGALIQDVRLISIYNNLGVLLFEEKRYEEAMACFQKVIKISPDHDAAYHNIANIYFINDDIDKAKYYYNEQIKRNFKHVNAHKMLFRLYLKEGQRHKALYGQLTYQYLQKINKGGIRDEQTLRKYLKVSKTLTQLGNYFFQEQNIIDAKRCYQAAVFIDPDNYVGHERLGQIYNQEDDKQKANFDKAGDIQNKEDNIELGTVLEKHGFFDAALKRYNAALTLDQENYIALFNIGNIHMRRQDWKQAEAAYRQSIAVNKDFADAYNNLAYLYLKTGKYILAHEYIDKALGFNCSRRFYYLDTKAQIFLAQRNISEALRFIKQAKLNQQNVPGQILKGFNEFWAEKIPETRDFLGNE